MTAAQPKVQRRTIFAAGNTARHAAIAISIAALTRCTNCAKPTKNAASQGSGRRREIFLYCGLVDAAVTMCKVCRSCRLHCRVSVVLASVCRYSSVLGYDSHQDALDALLHDALLEDFRPVWPGRRHRMHDRPIRVSRSSSAVRLKTIADKEMGGVVRCSSAGLWRPGHDGRG